ncbi:MAG TPA: Crp/Fnr family transcriptional regulator [Polyangiaceae bacterium]
MARIERKDVEAIFGADVLEASVDLLDGSAELVRADAGESFVQQDDPCQHAFALTRGAVKLLRTTVGVPRLLDVARGPVLVADAALFDGGPWSASVVALRGSSALRFSRIALVEAAAQDPQLARSFRAAAARTARALVMRIDTIGAGTVEIRLTRFFDDLAARYGTPMGNARFIALPLRRREIASLVGAEAETVSRLMARWTREGTLRASRDGILWSRGTILAR